MTFFYVFLRLQAKGGGGRGFPLLIRKTTTKQAKTSKQKTEAKGGMGRGGSVTPFTQPKTKHKTRNKKEALGGGGEGGSHID